MDIIGAKIVAFKYGLCCADRFLWFGMIILVSFYFFGLREKERLAERKSEKERERERERERENRDR